MVQQAENITFAYEYTVCFFNTGKVFVYLNVFTLTELRYLYLNFFIDQEYFILKNIFQRFY